MASGPLYRNDTASIVAFTNRNRLMRYNTGFLAPRELSDDTNFHP